MECPGHFDSTFRAGHPLATVAVLALLVNAASAQEGALIAPGAAVRRLATGFTFLEGPAADGYGNVYFTDIPNERIHRWTPGEGVTVFREDSDAPMVCASISTDDCSSAKWVDGA